MPWGTEASLVLNTAAATVGCNPELLVGVWVESKEVGWGSGGETSEQFVKK